MKKRKKERKTGRPKNSELQPSFFSFDHKL